MHFAPTNAGRKNRRPGHEILHARQITLLGRRLTDNDVDGALIRLIRCDLALRWNTRTICHKKLTIGTNRCGAACLDLWGDILFAGFVLSALGMLPKTILRCDR